LQMYPEAMPDNFVFVSNQNPEHCEDVSPSFVLCAT
jgi:hypothetical protein